MKASFSLNFPEKDVDLRENATSIHTLNAEFSLDRTTGPGRTCRQRPAIACKHVALYIDCVSCSTQSADL